MHAPIDRNLRPGEPLLLAAFVRTRPGSGHGAAGGRWAARLRTFGLTSLRLVHVRMRNFRVA